MREEAKPSFSYPYAASAFLISSTKNFRYFVLSCFLRYDDTCVFFYFCKVGTPLYMSPEVLKGGGYEWKSEVWSLGCVLYELAMLRSPFKSEGLNLYSLFQKISSVSAAAQHEPGRWSPTHIAPQRGAIHWRPSYEGSRAGERGMERATGAWRKAKRDYRLLSFGMYDEQHGEKKERLCHKLVFVFSDGAFCSKIHKS